MSRPTSRRQGFRRRRSRGCGSALSLLELRDVQARYGDVQALHGLTLTVAGGDQRRLALARGMMAKPRLLLLDEPSVDLAPLVVREIVEVLRRLNESGTTILVVEQNASLALAAAGHAFVLETGRIVLGGESASLREDESVRRSYLGY